MPAHEYDWEFYDIEQQLVQQLAQQQRRAMRQLQATRNEQRAVESMIWEAHAYASSCRFRAIPRQVVVMVVEFCGRDKQLADDVSKGLSLLNRPVVISLRAGRFVLQRRLEGTVLDYNPWLNLYSVALENGSEKMFQASAVSKLCRADHWSNQSVQPGMVSMTEQWLMMENVKPTMLTWPSKPSDITKEWVAACLELVDSNFSMTIEPPTVQGRTSTALKLVLHIGDDQKDHSRAFFLKVPAGDVWHKGFLREAYWYSTLLPSLPCGSVSPAACAVCPWREGYGFLFEDVSACPFESTVDDDKLLDQCKRIASSLAKLHSSETNLGCREAFPCEMALPQQPGSVDKLSVAVSTLVETQNLPPELASQLLHAGVTGSLSAAYAYCESLPQALLHCDVRPPHIFFRSPEGGACFIDWQRCGRGPAVADLCQFMCMCLDAHQLETEELEENIFACYLEAWDSRFVDKPSLDKLREDYNVCVVLQLAFFARVVSNAPTEQPVLQRALQTTATVAARLGSLGVLDSIIDRDGHAINQLASSPKPSCQIRMQLADATFYACTAKYHKYGSCEHTIGTVKCVPGHEVLTSRLQACSFCRPPFVFVWPCEQGDRCTMRSQCQCTHPGEPVADFSSGLYGPVSTRLRTQRRYSGSVKSICWDQGYGFIKCPQLHNLFGQDIWVHRHFVGGCAEGDEVSFDVQLNDCGQPQAIHLCQSHLRHGHKSEKFLGRVRSPDDRNQPFLPRPFDPRPFEHQRHAFISCPELEARGCSLFVYADINEFAHIASERPLAPGLWVEFKVKWSEQGQPQALDIHTPIRYSGWMTSESKDDFCYLSCLEVFNLLGVNVLAHQRSVKCFKVGDRVDFLLKRNASGLPEANNIVASPGDSSYNHNIDDCTKVYYDGKLKSFNSAKGYGFITCSKVFDLLGKDVFVHQSQMCYCIADTHVRFRVKINNRGCPQAWDVTPITLIPNTHVLALGCSLASVAVPALPCMLGVMPLAPAALPQADVQGDWSKAAIRGTVLIWSNGQHDPLFEYTGTSFKVILGGSIYAAELRSDGRLHWNDGDVWERRVPLSWPLAPCASFVQMQHVLPVGALPDARLFP